MSLVDALADTSETLERALVAAMDDGGLPVPIRTIVDPAATPAAWLPWLAAHESVNLWFGDWSEARKRLVVTNAPLDAHYIGTRAGSIRYLAYVDGTLVDAVAYPTRFVLGRAVIGRTPINHPPFLARYLVKVETSTPPRALVLSRGVLGRARLKTPSREPFDRCLAAIRVAKAPETEVRVDFGVYRRLRLSDAPCLDAGYRLDSFIARSKL